MNPDIIGLQETHKPDNKNEVVFMDTVAKSLHLFSTEITPYGPSHIKKENHLSLATLSRYPLQEYSFFTLPNPNFRFIRPNGDVWKTFDVGISHCSAKLDSQRIHILNTHLVPFHYFERNVMEEAFQYIREAIERMLMTYAESPTIVMGDFNYPDLFEMLPSAIHDGGFRDVFVGEETAPGKDQQDHILVSRHWKINRYEIRKVLADHYQCIADISLMKSS